jgi:NTP pyrophosphatase (non-canonical NTP hydrolase)
MAANSKTPRSITKVKPTVDEMKAYVDYLSEMRAYREERNRPNNKLYYVAKLAEEVGEVSEAAVALEGSRRKLAKFKAEGVTPLEKITEELADVINTAFLCAEQHGITPGELLRKGVEKMELKRLKNNGGTSGK